MRLQTRSRAILPKLRLAEEARGYRHGCSHSSRSQSAFSDTDARADTGPDTDRNPVHTACRDHSNPRHGRRTHPKADNATSNAVPDSHTHPASCRNCAHTDTSTAHTNTLSCSDPSTHTGPHSASRCDCTHTDTDDSAANTHPHIAAPNTYPSSYRRPASSRNRTHSCRNTSAHRPHTDDHPQTDAFANNLRRRRAHAHANPDSHFASCRCDLDPSRGDAGANAHTHSGCRFSTSYPRPQRPSRGRHASAGSPTLSLNHPFSRGHTQPHGHAVTIGHRCA